MEELTFTTSEPENFHYYDGITILMKEIICQDASIIFEKDEIDLLHKYDSLDYEIRKNYLKLLFRQRKIVKALDIKHHGELAINTILNILRENRFIENYSSLPIEEILKIMTKSNLDQLIKEFKISCKFSQTMEQKINIILKQVNSSSLLTHFYNKNHIKSIHPILKRCFELVGPCITITALSRTCFNKLFCYVSAKTDLDKFTSSVYNTISHVGQSILLTLSRLKSRQLVFPSYEWEWVSLIPIKFSSIHNFNDYVNIFPKYIKIINSISKKDKIKCSKYYDVFFPLLEVLVKSYIDSSPPYDLYHATVVKACYKLSDALETSGSYEKSLCILDLLLAQKIYSSNKRGHWYEREALIYEKKVKNIEKAIETIKEALQDQMIMDFQKYSLSKRCVRLLAKDASNDVFIQSIDYLNSISMPPSINIKGKRVLVETQKMTYSKFVTTNNLHLQDTENVNNNNTITLSNVENYALNYYHNECGFTHGLFAEGGPFVTLFGLVFWDIIYKKCDNKFISAYQIQPLDFFSRNFLKNRHDLIQNRLTLIESSNHEKIYDIIKLNWSSNVGCSSPCVNWELFEDFDSTFMFFNCLGSSLVKGIFLRLLENFAAFSSGLPDLVVWNPDKKMHLISEVKGPGDKLSHKQILWIDILKRLGANVHVCYVKD